MERASPLVLLHCAERSNVLNRQNLVQKINMPGITVRHQNRGIQVREESEEKEEVERKRASIRTSCGGTDEALN